jgi:hypothetical protein
MHTDTAQSTTRRMVALNTHEYEFARNFFLLLACAFMLVASSQGNAQLFTPSVKELVDRKGFTWKSEDTANFRFYFEPSTFGEKHIDRLKENAEQSRKRVLTLLGEQIYRDRVTLFVLDSRRRMKALIGKETNGLALPQRNAVLYVFNEKIDASGAHELCHVLAKNLWGKADDWINEGLAVYSDGVWQQYQLHDLAKYLWLKTKLIPLEEILEHFEKYPDFITYPEMGSFVKFLYEKYGMENVREIWKKDAAAIPRITGRSLNELEKDWFEVLGKADASKVTYVTISAKRWDR